MTCFWPATRLTRPDLPICHVYLKPSSLSLSLSLSLCEGFRKLLIMSNKLPEKVSKSLIFPNLFGMLYDPNIKLIEQVDPACWIVYKTLAASEVDESENVWKWKESSLFFLFFLTRMRMCECDSCFPSIPHFLFLVN